MSALGALGHALAAGLSGVGDGMVEGAKNDIKEADERKKEAARLQEISATADAQLMKEKAIARFNVDLANEPLNRASAVAKAKLAEAVPVSAAPVTELTSGDPGTGYQNPDGTKANDAIKGNYEDLKERLSQIQDPDDRAAALETLEKQRAGEQSKAQASVTATRPRTATEATKAALDDLKVNDPAAYKSYSEALKAQQMHLGTGGMLVDTNTGEILVQNHTAEAIADKKIAAASALADKNLAAKQEMLQIKVNAAASAKIIDPKAVENAAQLYATYAIKPPGDRFMQSAFGQAVAQKIKEINPEYSAIRYGEIDKSVKAFSTGKQGDSVRSFNVAIDHANTANSLIDAMANKDTQTLNKVGNFFGKQFGKDETTNFIAVKDIVADEIAKAVIGGQTAQGDREKLAHNLDEAKSPEQLRGVILQWKSLMRGQLDGLRDQYERTTGHSDFDEHFLSKAAREAIHNSVSAVPSPTVTPNPVTPASKIVGGYPADIADIMKKYGNH